MLPTWRHCGGLKTDHPRALADLCLVIVGKNYDSNATHHALYQNVLRKFKSAGEKDLRDALLQYLTNCQTRHPLWKVDRPTDLGQKKLFEISSGRGTCSIFHTHKPGDGDGSGAATAPQRVDAVAGNCSSLSPRKYIHIYIHNLPVQVIHFMVRVIILPIASFYLMVVFSWWKQFCSTSEERPCTTAN